MATHLWVCNRSSTLHKHQPTVIESIEANPQRVSTEIIIEIKQLNSGRMASHASIESIMVYPLKDAFTIKMDFYLYKSFYILM